MTTPHPDLPAVAVVGLGPMGGALAGALLAGGAPTTVWNRTRSRAEALVAEGARCATDLETAVRSVDLVGAADRGLDLLLGAIMTPVPLSGTQHAQNLYAGDPALVERHRDVLSLMAGRTEHVGTDPGLASLLDTAMLEVYFAGMTSFLHAAAITTAQGVDARTFARYARDVLDLLPDTVDGLAAGVDDGTHPGVEDTITMELAALEHMVATSRASGVDPKLPALMRDLARDAVAAGHGDESWSRVVDVLRRGPR